MDPSISAFAMYQQMTTKKRKRNQVNKVSKKRVKTANNFKTKRKNNLQNGVANSSGKIKRLKNKSKNKATEKGGTNGLASSDEEIPLLVPISDESEKKIAKKKVKDTNKKIKLSEFNDNSRIKSKHQKVTKKNINEVSIFNPVTQGLAIFKWLIDPISPIEFFEKYWEKEVLHVRRSDVKYFEDVFSSAKLDNILREYPLHYTRNIDVVVYENGKKEVLNSEGRAMPSQLWDYYSNGCSIRVLNPHTYDQNVHSLISSLQEYFGTMVGTNVYLTPPGSQGFAPHFDDIEAFIIQLEGSKYWKLYKPKDEDVLARDSSPNFNAADLGTPFLEVELNAGDLLYFPRGTIHEGHTSENMHSLHITVSVYQHTAYADLLEQILPDALKKASNQDVEFRRGLPLHYLKHLGIVNCKENSAKRQFVINKVKSLMESLVNYIDIDAAADNLGRKFMYDAMPPLYSQEEAQHSSKFDGDYMKNGIVYNRVEIDLETKVRLLRYYALRVVKENENSYRLYYCTDNAKTYHGEEEQWLEIDNSLITGFETLQKKYPEFLEVNNIPIPEDSAKLQLVSDLWERGLLVTETALPNISSDVESNSSSISSDQVYQIIND